MCKGMDDAEFDNMWSDDQKMNVMFSVFRDKSVNPLSWEQKMNFWQETIERYCAKNDLVIVLPSTLPIYFTRKGRTPQCLDVVIAEMKRIGKLKTLSVLETESVSMGWLYWGYAKFIRSPLSWAVNLASSMISKNNKCLEESVMTEVLKRKAEQLLSIHLERVRTHQESDIIDYNSLVEQHAELFKDKREVPLLVSYLVKQQKALLIPQGNNKNPLIKFTDNQNVNVSPVKCTDLKIYQIQCVEIRLGKQVNTLTEDIKRLSKEAREHVKSKSRQLALYTLKRKKNCEMILEKKLATLDILHNLIDKIKTVTTDQQVLEAYACGVSAMKVLTKDINLEKAENVIDQLHDTLGEQEEVSHLLANAWPDSNEDSEALEDELQKLIKEEESAAEDEALAKSLSNLRIQDKSFSKVSISDPITEEAAPLLEEDDDEIPVSSTKSKSKSKSKSAAALPAF
ncbi:charged multivesicular body protein 7 isoform X1 [Octopus bimaculoides]|uniref:Charged multivesicular body protein 7 n=2 Tax=Octopus bimaculoides TaxID=37653 RepID=A0A0L8FWR1_OCTBM|nr:charged multivesicular body protein 7 isoform X1 [Octopus bimaculoides]|eukprot:XP_014786192.1 PREDICTED: charged multivesicular body protein 7-like isoform X1 [Octopus bimaculoides]